MEKITAAIITRDEERNIAACLQSICWVDEIIVYDSGSRDNTVSICKQFGARVLENQWPGYRDQKNNAVDKASHDWILSLDADERLSPGLILEIKNLRRRGLYLAGYRMPRRTFYLGKWINSSGWRPDRKLRLFHKSKGRWEGRLVHETVVVRGRVGDLKNDIYHYPYSSIYHHLKK